MSGTVLCVDDDRDFCQILAKALGEEGFTVDTATDGETAVRKIADEAPDLVLLDLILSRKDGFKVLEEVRAMDGPVANTAVLILSGCSPTPEYRARADALCAAGLLQKPVPLDTLVAAVREHVGERKLENAAGGSGARPSRRAANAPLSGPLDRLAFPALLHHLHGLRATGVLHLVDGRKLKWILIREGSPVAVRSNLVNECLGNFLVRSGRISQAQHAVSRRHMKRGGLQGEVLVGMDILTEEEMTEALRAQADEKLFQIFEWSGGTYRFDKGAELQRANALGIDRSPANLILRGVRERFPAERITEYLRDHADCFVAPGESPYYRFQEVDIEPEHRTLLESLDGTQRLSEFVDAPDDLRRAICAFVSIGLIELRRQITHNPHRVASPQGARENDADATDDGVRAELAAMAERFESQTLFEILGVDPDADEDRIRGAYEDLGKRTHPDRFRTSTEPVRELAEDVFARISRAYETLVNPRRRGEYVLDQRREEREQRKVEDSKKAIRADSEFRRGEALLGARSYEESLVCFGRALELYPEEGDYYVHYGWALFLCHPDEIAIAEEAIEHIRRGLSVATHRDKAYLYMGRLYKALGRPDIAERLFVRAARIQPKCHEAMRELRLIQMRREKRKGLIGRLLRR